MGLYGCTCFKRMRVFCRDVRGLYEHVFHTSVHVIIMCVVCMHINVLHMSMLYNYVYGLHGY